MLDFNHRSGIAERINAAVDAALEAERAATPPRDYLGGSRLGHPCERALQFEFAGAPKDEGQDFPSRVLRIFAIGHQLEDLAIRWLRAAGLDLYTCKGNRTDGAQFGFSVAGGRIRGHVDGIVADVPAALGLRTPALWECKTMNAKNWRACVKNGVTVSKPVYAAQIALYQAYMEATVPGISAAPALFTAINKGHGRAAPRARALRRRSRAAHVRPWRADPASHRCGRSAPAHRRQPRLLRMPLLPLGRALLELVGMSDDKIVHFNPWRDFNDAAPLDDPFSVELDPAQIATFVDVVFGYFEGLIPVRGFVDKGQGKDGRPHNIWIDADAMAPDKLATFAGWAAREGAAVYVIPGTVEETGQARAADVQQMQSLVVDLDSGDIPAKLDHLVHHLGRPTLIVESGGRTPEGATKLHVWWKLTEPAEGSALAQLCQLRGEIALKVGGDTHFRSTHQPIRVPGTVLSQGRAHAAGADPRDLRDRARSGRDGGARCRDAAAARYRHGDGRSAREARH